MIRPDFVNHRMPGETFKAYRRRLRQVAAAIETHLRGRIAHEATRTVTLPLLGVDPQADAAVLAGRYRDVKLVTLPAPARDRFGKPLGTGEQIRVGRTKGVTYRRYPAGMDRREHRQAARA